MFGRRLLSWYIPLLLASAAGCFWVLYRVKATGSGSYTFMVWNLFLAWIPMWAATGFRLLYGVHSKGKGIRALMGALFAVWLVFLPNSPYVVTDLIHFTYVRGEGVWPWSDLFMLMLFAWTGLMLGYYSMLLMQEAVRRSYGGAAGWSFISVVLVLDAIGVFVGRELRWNSWWVISNPGRLWTDLDAFTKGSTYGFIGMTAVFCTVGYLMIYSLTMEAKV